MHQGIDHQTRQLAERQGERYLDIALILRRKSTKETLLCAGGQWDRIERRYTGRTPSKVRYVNVVESQVPLVKWAGSWFDDMAAGRPRDVALSLAIGNRRAGKTVGTMSCVTYGNLRCPRVGWHGLITWIVGVTRPEMQELDRYLRWLLPADWYEYKAQEHIFRLAVGSEIHAISADDPKTLKRGEANVILLNEAQKMPVQVLSNAIMGSVDHNGLCLLAANQPEDRRGEWVARLQRGVRSGQIQSSVVWPMDVKDNDEVDQSAYSRGAGILEGLDPEGYRRDVLNQDILQEGKCLPHFDPQIHVRPRPQIGLIDITFDVTFARVGRGYHLVIGQDYQSEPYMPGVAYKVYGTRQLQQYLRGELDREQLDPERDAPHYWIVDDVKTRKGATEHDLCDEMWLKGWRPETAYCVGDASGSWQNGRHDIGDNSFTVIKSRRWHVVPPFEAPTDRDVKPLNPKRSYRINLARRLLGIPPEELARQPLLAGEEARGPTAPRWFIEPHCTFGIKALSEAELRVGRRSKEVEPYGFFSHYFDGATYVLCHLEPRPEERHTSTNLPENLEQVMDEMRRRRALKSL